MKHLTTLLLLVLAITFTSAQKLEIVEGDLTTLDTVTVVSVEFYYAGMTINNFPNAENFLRANAGDKELKMGFLSATDSLNEQAFLAGYSSTGKGQIPELVDDTKTTPFHLIIKSVHWTSALDMSAPDDIVLEFILLDNPQRRLQRGRYYMRKVSGDITENVEGNMSTAYYRAGQTLAATLKLYDPSSEEEE